MPDSSQALNDNVANAAEPVLLMEGYQPDFFVPEVTYVQQDNKVCFFLGESDQRDASLSQLNESHDNGVQLVEFIEEMDLVEVTLANGVKTRLPRDGIWTVEGPYQRSDVFNANKRAYRRKLWEKQIGDPNSAQQKKVKARGMIGHLEHPTDGRTDGNKGALLTTYLGLREDGVVWGKSELLETPVGNILQEYTRKKVRWGVSSRGNGTVGDDGYVNEDYVLDTFDAVMTPSTPGSYPTPVKSGAGKSESEESEDLSEMTEDVKTCIQEVEALAEATLDGLDETSRRDLAARLLDQHSRVNSLVGSSALSSRKAIELQDWLMRKLRETHEASGPAEADEVDQIIEDALHEDSDDDKDAAFRRVIESLQARVSDAMEDSESVREQVERLKSEQAEIAQERDEARTELEVMRLELESVQLQLELATSLIQDHSTTEVENPVEGAVDEAIAEVPKLAEYRDQLLEAETPLRVEEIAVDLIAAGVGSNGDGTPNATKPSSIARRALPTGNVVSEATAGSSRFGTNPSRQARMAGKAIATMKPKTKT